MNEKLTPEKASKIRQLDNLIMDLAGLSFEDYLGSTAHKEVHTAIQEAVKRKQCEGHKPTAVDKKRVILRESFDILLRLIK